MMFNTLHEKTKASIAPKIQSFSWAGDHVLKAALRGCSFDNRMLTTKLILVL